MPAWPVKTEISEVLNAITMMGRTFKWPWPHRWIPTLDPRPFKMHQLGKPTTRGRINPGQEQQAVDVICATKQLISSAVVPFLAEYTQVGKVSRNTQNLLILGNGDPFLMIQWTIHGLLRSMTFTQGIHTCSKTLLCTFKQTLWPIYLNYTRKALEKRKI